MFLLYTFLGQNFKRSFCRSEILSDEKVMAVDHNEEIDVEVIIIYHLNHVDEVVQFLTLGLIFLCSGHKRLTFRSKLVV